MGMGGLKRSVCVKGWDLNKLHVERARWKTSRKGAGSSDWKEWMGQSRGQGSPLPSQGGGRRGWSRRQGVHRFGGLRASRQGCSLVPLLTLDGTHVFLCFLHAGGKMVGQRKEGARGSTRLVFPTPSLDFYLLEFSSSIRDSTIPACWVHRPLFVITQSSSLSLVIHKGNSERLRLKAWAFSR